VAITMAMGRNHARMRYALWLAASVKFVIPFSLLIAAGIAVDWPGRPTLPETEMGVSTIAEFIATPTTTGTAPSPLIPVWLAALVWLTGCLIVLALWFRAWRRARRIVLGSAPLTNNQARLPKYIDGLTHIRVSRDAKAPGVYGLLRPVLLLPADIENRLSDEELEAVIAHEAAHVRRRDNLTTAFHTIVTAVFWYHPFVWLIGKRMINERERACDEEALVAGHSPEVFAEGLLKVCRTAVGMPPECVAGIHSSNLKSRIEGIMRYPQTRKVGPVLRLILVVFAVVVVLGPVTIGLTKPAPAGVGNLLQTESQSPEQGEGDGESEDEANAALIRWVEQDVVYIIEGQERRAFESLGTDEEREQFIESFWFRRDPTPGTSENEFLGEHYRRIAYANGEFAYQLPGWQSDRGRIYIIHGEPDGRETHPNGGVYEKSLAEGGGTALTYPFDQWRYRLIQGVGQEVIFEFVDPSESGEYRLAMSPTEKYVSVQAEQQAPIQLQFVLYQNDVLVARPRLSLPNGTSGRVSQSGGELSLDVSVRANRVEEDQLLLDLVISVDGLQMVQPSIRIAPQSEASVKFARPPEARINLASPASPEDRFELRITEVSE
jgi:GWxTD domain-containing protein